MDEVSWRMFELYVDLASRNGIPAEKLCGGIPAAGELLARRRRWLDWDDYVTLVERYEALIGGPARHVETLKDGQFRQVVRPFNAVVSYFTSARAVYRIGQKWFAPSLYRHIDFGFEEVDRDTVRLSLSLRPGYRDSDAFFRAWAATLRFAPLQIGLPESQVEVERRPGGAVLTVRMPQRRSVTSRVRQWLHAVTRATDVVDELASHERMLRESYESLLTLTEASQVALRASEERQRALVASLPDLVVVFGLDGTVREVQGAPGHRLAGALERLRGRSLEEAGAPEGLGADAASRLLDAARHAGGEQRELLEFSIDAGPERLHFECRVAPLTPGDSVLCVIRDTTEQKRLEMQLLLSDRMASLGTLATAVAHEINNPLAAMLGILEYSRRTGTGGSHAIDRQSLEDALHAGTQIAEIVGQLDSLGRRGDAVEPVELNELLDTMLRLTEHRIRPCATVVRAYGEVPRVSGHRGRLGQVFANLLINAAQAIPEGSPESHRIEVRTELAAGGEAIVEIRDTGIGIPDDVLPRIFDPFFSNRRTGDGLGLGLAISHRIVTDLGGAIEARSAPGGGTTFRISLRAWSGEVPVARIAPAPPPRAGLRLLVVDDNLRFGMSLQALLDEHRVTVEGSGRAALERLRTERFDVILCDLVMPDVDGMQLYRELKASSPGEERRLVFMSAGLVTAEAREFVASVANRCLPKPFRKEQLDAVLAAATAQRYAAAG